MMVDGSLPVFYLKIQMDLSRQPTLLCQCHDVINMIEHFSFFVPFDSNGELITKVEFHLPDPSDTIDEEFCTTDERGWFYISVCDVHSLYAFDENGIQKWTRVDLDNPGQVQIFQGQLYIVMWNNLIQTTRVEIYDRDTGVFQRFCKFPEPFPFRDFHGHAQTLGILSTGEFILTDWKGRVFVVPSENSNAKHVTFFNTNSVSSQIFSMSSVYVHSDDTIWLPQSLLNYRLNIYTKFGQHLRTMNLINVYWSSPCSISISKIGEIFVACGRNGLSVYNIGDLSFNRKITNKSSGDNSYPDNIQDIAVSKNGNVILYGSHQARIVKPVVKLPSSPCDVQSSQCDHVGEKRFYSIEKDENGKQRITNTRNPTT